MRTNFDTLPWMTLDPPADPYRIDDAAALAALYGEPGASSLRKEVASLHPVYRAIVEAAPFAVLATVGPDGVDASPRGDAPASSRCGTSTRCCCPIAAATTASTACAT